jgi:hypothetical protein
MTDDNDKINRLQVKLDSLIKRQGLFLTEINTLKEEIIQLKIYGEKKQSIEKDLKENKPITTANIEIPKTKVQFSTKENVPQVPVVSQLTKRKKKPKIEEDLEKFIGENLINKIGIAVTVIGVSIGVKYAIDHELISPLARILLGYAVGFVLLGFALNFKRKYVNFSAVLLSGSMAIMYFITYVAFSYYSLYNQNIAFILMVIITIFTVFSALKYDTQVIAHIGLVGAYAVPFLLSPEPGKIFLLFSYMAIINIGILVIAFIKYWKPLYYSSFLITWALFFFWFLTSYESGDNFLLTFIFISIFFMTFYTMFMANKLIQNEKFKIDDVILILLNSFIFYGVGYEILSNNETGQYFLGLFTLCNAVIHFIASLIIYRQKLADQNLFYLVGGLVLIFTTIAIPVQLNGNWVTLLWIGEATLLFWIGRTKKISLYEFISYPIIILAFFSLLQDWSSIHKSINQSESALKLLPLLNIYFLSSILFICGISLINYLNRNRDYPTTITKNKFLLQIISITIPAILLFTIYNTFKIEIEIYFAQLYRDSIIVDAVSQDSPKIYKNKDILKFETMWVFNYTLLFLTILSFVNIKKIKNQQLAFINLGLIVFAIFLFLLEGLYTLSELRESYLESSLSSYEIGIYHIYNRYISLGFVALLLASTYKYIQKDFIKKDFKVAFDALLYISIAWIASSELIHWMDMASSTKSYKLGLSILWGMYSLLLIALGIWKKKKYLRIGAMILFGITLIKLFTYDISNLDTISKTIVFISLGTLLLIISFLYNKYAHIISDKIEK